MNITQELQSFNGCYRFDTIENIISFAKADGKVLRGFANPMHIIWCNRSGTMAYPMAFPNIDLRNKAYAYLRECKANFTNHVHLDLIEFFYPTVVSDSVVANLVTLPISKHIRFKIEQFMKLDGMTIGRLQELDAFSVFTAAEIAQIRTGKHLIADEKALTLWAKVFGLPNYARVNGINAIQFFKQLNHNEKVSNPSNAIIIG